MTILKYEIQMKKEKYEIHKGKKENIIIMDFLFITKTHDVEIL